jgi:hypothetical protein
MVSVEVGASTLPSVKTSSHLCRGLRRLVGAVLLVGLVAGCGPVRGVLSLGTPLPPVDITAAYTIRADGTVLVEEAFAYHVGDEAPARFLRQLRLAWNHPAGGSVHHAVRLLEATEVRDGREVPVALESNDDPILLAWAIGEGGDPAAEVRHLVLRYELPRSVVERDGRVELGWDVLGHHLSGRPRDVEVRVAGVGIREVTCRVCAEVRTTGEGAVATAVEPRLGHRFDLIVALDPAEVRPTGAWRASALGSAVAARRGSS